MDRPPDNRRISLKLSEVLNDIDVSERVVRKRRKCIILKEQCFTFSSIFQHGEVYGGRYHFGSQSEGTTTRGLHSDLDTLFYTRDRHVIQDWAEWEPGVINLLMLRDETSPGYCLLQLLQSDAPLAETHDVPEHCLRDNKGRILFKNTWANAIRPAGVTQQNGPAGTVEGIPGLVDQDVVPALHCVSWPEEGRGWLDRQCIGNWPSEDIKRLAVSKGCFLVPVGSKCADLDDVEWRISTSMAERLMMFNMNITQIRTYVMLKFTCKTFFIMNGNSTITSFMCKCVVFTCIENTPKSSWCEDNLLDCVIKCLSTLYKCVQNLNCPHYIIPANNLMANGITSDQQQYLLNVISSLINFHTDMFCNIQIDGLGKRLQMKLINELVLPQQVTPEVHIVFYLMLNQAGCFGSEHTDIICKQIHKGLLEVASSVVKGIQNLQRHNGLLNDIAIEARRQFLPLLFSSVGSILAAFSVYTNKTVSPEAIGWFSAGLDSDVSSCRLKLASAYYCAGDINNAELVLREIEHKYTDVVVPVCGCYPLEKTPYPIEQVMHVHRNEESIHESFAFCVKFLKCEASIFPPELRQELFRSTESDFQYRSVWDKVWMAMAVVDSRPYLYFLQYKVYKHQGRVQQRRKALSNLLTTNLNERNLGHRDTAWNLLGQCMEQENMIVEARWCYQRSLEVRPRNNVANFLLARMPRV